MPEWRVRPYRPGDEAGILALFSLVFGRPRSLAHWRWKFADNPFNPRPPGQPPAPLISLAEAPDGRLVGQYALLPVPLWVEGRLTLAAQSIDTMTHPDFQGQGMFTTLARDAFARAQALGVTVLYGFPNPNSYPGFVRRLGWRDLGRMRTWARPVDLGTRIGLPGRAAQAIWDALTLPPRAPAASVGPASRLLDPALGEGLTRLAEEAGRRLPVAVARLPAYWRWRYADCPDTAYRLMTVEDGGALRGAVVFEAEARLWRLVDWLCDPTPPWPRQVLAAWVALARAARPAPAAATLWTGATPAEAGALRRLGFRRLKEGGPFIVRVLAEEVGGAPLDFGAWRLTGGDSDLY